MTRIRVAAIACDHGWEKTEGCPAVFAANSDGGVSHDQLFTAASASGWTSDHVKDWGARHFCPKHPASG